MAIQTSISFFHGKALKGQRVETPVRLDISSYAAAAVEFGVGVVHDGAATEESPKVKVPTATGGKFLGVTLIRQDEQRGTPDFMGVVESTMTSRYEIGTPITTRSIGRVWVYAEQAVNPSAAVFLRHTTNSALIAGDFRVDADTSRADAITNARWISQTTAAGLALLELF